MEEQNSTWGPRAVTHFASRKRLVQGIVVAALLVLAVAVALRVLVRGFRAKALMDDQTTPKPDNARTRTSSWEEDDWTWSQSRFNPRRQTGEAQGVSAPGARAYSVAGSAYGAGVLERQAPYSDGEWVDLTETEEYRRYYENDPWKNGTITAPALEAEAEEAGIDWKALVQEIAETALLTLLIFVVIRALGQNFRIEGFSMEPNLHEQQYLIVSKVSYYLSEPQRGDIIVFEYPNGDPNGPEKDFIKRIIGLPGDTVECRPGEIIVNGEVIQEPYGPNPGSYSCPPTTLGPDEYFVLGDNRNQSSDSHAWGPLGRQYIIGKAVVIYWPFEDWGRVPNYPIEAPPPQSSVAQQTR